MNTKVDAAAAKVLGRQKRPKAVAIREVPVPIVEQPIVVRASGELAFTRGEKASPHLAHILIYDEGLNAYRPVLTPPGTSWELVEKRQGPRLYVPGERT